MRRTLLVSVVALSAAVGMSAQSGSPAPPQSGVQSAGQQYVMKVELQKVPVAAGQQANDMFAMAGDMFRQMMLPDGAAEMAVTTDGQSVRTELRGRWAMIPSGSIMLSRQGETNGGYVLNPADKTYYVIKVDDVKMPELPGGMAMPKPEVSVKPSGTFDTIAGHRAEKIDISWRMAMPIPEGVELPPGFPTEVTLDIEEWCASDLKIPPVNSIQAVAAIGKMMPGMGMDDMMKSCSFPMRSRLRMSMMPGYEIRFAVTSITDVPLSPDLFTLPAGYKEVPMPAPKLPGIGG